VNNLAERMSWEEFKSRIQEHFNKENLIYQPILHPDFDGWTVSRPSEGTFRLILSFIGVVKGKRILDIGCCLGYHSHLMTKKGAAVTGIEIKKERIEFCRYLSGLYNVWPEFLCEDITDYIVACKEHFDIVLCLNMIHWLFSQRGEQAWETMRKISQKCDVMFLSFEDKMRTHERFDLWKCLEKTSFDNMERIGFPDGKAWGPVRPIYRFWKNGQLPDRFDIDSHELMKNTYNRCDRPQPFFSYLGTYHGSTARMLADDINVEVKKLPLYTFMQGENYRILRARNNPQLSKIIEYLNNYRRTMKSIQKHGYDTRKSTIKFIELNDGTAVIRDGHRRLNSIIALGGKTVSIERWKLEKPPLWKKIWHRIPSSLRGISGR